MIPTATDNQIPRPGMLATVRNRRGTVAAVDPFDGESGRLHLVHVEYQDGMLEAMNSLIRAAKVPARGYRTMENFITMAYLVCGKLAFNLPT